MAVPHYDKLIQALRDFQKWTEEIDNGGAIYSPLGRRPLDAIVDLFENPQLETEFNARIAEANARLDARRDRERQQNLSECGKLLKTPGSLKLPRPLFHAVLREILDGEACSSGIANSADVIRSLREAYDHVTRELPTARGLPRKLKKSRKTKLNWRTIALIAGIALLAGNFRWAEHACVCEIALALIKYGSRKRDDD